MTDLKKITQDELDEILRLHKLWLESKGKAGKLANLTAEHLRGANWRGANLKGLDLRGASFKLADFIGVDLTQEDSQLSTIYSTCYLERRTLYGIDLRRVNLTGANISHLTKQEFLHSTIRDKYTILTDVKFKEEE
jgi:uncharacterized protein YjbI with pentapeptide repeats